MSKSYIFDARKKSGKTQTEVADILGMSPQTYASKEQRKDFTTVELKKIGDFIGEDLIKVELNLLQEEQETYGKAGAQYRKMLSTYNEVKNLQMANLIIQAEILAAIKKKPTRAILNDLAKIIKDKTGIEINL